MPSRVRERVAGKSMSGLAALLVEDIARKPNQMRNTIRQGADGLAEAWNDPFYGKGRINIPNTVAP
ncbi:MAG TPA: hypothetical protein VJ596_03440 [Gemmatimonadaceae bacterium]|nr:hypothetical protein [Gemmatimonadaceae bacterium]